MSKDLKPCPFCGGKTTIASPEIKTILSNIPSIPLIKCQKCGAVVSFDNGLCNAGCVHGDWTPVVDAYNTRYERTCHVRQTGCATGICSACGGEYQASITTNEPPDYVMGSLYCPNCGAKVVSNYEQGDVYVPLL